MGFEQGSVGIAETESLVKRPISKEEFYGQDLARLPFPVKRAMELTFFPEDSARQSGELETMLGVINTLDYRQKGAIRVRYFSDGGKILSVGDAAREFWLTKGGFLAREKEAFRLLKHPSRIRLYKQYLNPPQEILVK